MNASDPVTVVGVDGGGALYPVARVYTNGIGCAILVGSCGPGGPGPVVCWGYGSDLGGVSNTTTGVPQPVLLPP
jgi:hypothetical protein